jgi:hypothetical protein
MPKTAPYARIAITLPKRDLAAADRLAQTLDRPRSWVVAEAIRRFAAAPPVPAAPTGAPGNSPGNAPVASQSGLGASRLAQLTADLALSPEERVRAAEETLRLSELGNRSRNQSLRTFDTYLDYLDFKRRRIVER